jgi:hypothetical protein
VVSFPCYLPEASNHLYEAQMQKTDGQSNHITGGIECYSERGQSHGHFARALLRIRKQVEGWSDEKIEAEG